MALWMVSGPVCSGGVRWSSVWSIARCRAAMYSSSVMICPEKRLRKSYSIQGADVVDQTDSCLIVRVGVEPSQKDRIWIRLRSHDHVVNLFRRTPVPLMPLYNRFRPINIGHEH